MGDWRPRLPSELRDRVQRVADGRPLEEIARRAVEAWLEAGFSSPRKVRVTEAGKPSRTRLVADLPEEPAGVNPVLGGPCLHLKEWETRSALMTICDLAKGGCGHRLR